MKAKIIVTLYIKNVTMAQGILRGLYLEDVTAIPCV